MKLSATNTRVTGDSTSEDAPSTIAGILFNGIPLVYNGESITYNQA